MDIEHLRTLPRGQKQIAALYDMFHEANRLESQAGAVEFLMSVQLIEETLPREASILDLGAGTGCYSRYFAAKKHRVKAVDLVEKHVEQIRSGIEPGMDLEAICADALSALCVLPDRGFDAVLLMGPLYHLYEDQDRLRCLQECARVTKPGGYIYPAFINADMVVMTMTLMGGRGQYMTQGDYDKESFRPEDFPFRFDRLAEAEDLVSRAGLRISCQIATDMLNELCGAAVNLFNDQDYAQWLRFQWHLCKQRHFLGASSHWLFRVGGLG